MADPRYIYLIDESVKATKKTLEDHDLLQYMLDPDGKAIDGYKIENSDVEPRHVYEIAAYSTLVEISDMLHAEYETGEALPIKLNSDAKSSQSRDVTMADILGGAKGIVSVSTKSGSKKGLSIKGLENVPEEHRGSLMEALEEIIKELKEGEE